MKTVRHHFISNDLDDLEKLEIELEQAGLARSQVHVLTLDDAGADNHKQLHDVSSMMKTDVVRSSEIGAAIGLLIGVALLVAASIFNWADTIGWLPIVFLGLIIIGFAAWEGGFLGIQKRNAHFKRFEQSLQDGNHIFFVDLPEGQRATLEECVSNHPNLAMAGTDKGISTWLLPGVSARAAKAPRNPAQKTPQPA